MILAQNKKVVFGCTGVRREVSHLTAQMLLSLLLYLTGPRMRGNVGPEQFAAQTDGDAELVWPTVLNSRLLGCHS